MSVPAGLYLVVPGPVQLDDYALARAAPAMQRLAEGRGYLGRNTPLLKQVAAVENETVCRFGQVVVVARQLVIIALSTDRAGRHMPTWRGCRRLREGQVFLLGTHGESFDSRYFGPVDRDQIIGAAIPLLTE